MQHKAIIDDREDTRMDQFLDDAGFAVYRERMKEGDYVIDGRIIFSLKSMQDFITSRNNGHLHNEIEAMLGSMEANYDKFLALIIFGNANGQMASVYESIETINAFYLPVFTAPDRQGAIALMSKWAEKCAARKYSTFPLQVKRRVEVHVPKAIDPIVKMYRVGFGVGDETSRTLFAKYPTMQSLMGAIEADASAERKWADGIIRVKGKRLQIEKILGSLYNPSAESDYDIECRLCEQWCEGKPKAGLKCDNFKRRST